MHGSTQRPSSPAARLGWRLLCLMLCVACVSVAQTPPEPADDDAMEAHEVLEISENGSATFSSDVAYFNFKWLELSDSRCPEGAQCIVAGQAQLRLQVERDGQDPETIVLVLSADDRRPQSNGTAQVGDHTVRLTAVEPYPSVEEPAADGSHRAVLRIEAASAESSDGHDG